MVSFETRAIQGPGQVPVSTSRRSCFLQLVKTHANQMPNHTRHLSSGDAGPRTQLCQFEVIHVASGGQIKGTLVRLGGHEYLLTTNLSNVQVSD
ncbi:unnamed protein product [Protopolystoma xenopodis]|uniref:Uncharacterized protein n=1 Tax=Protopolystoma xenopodis TaxID=117903 RepID=A0A448XQY6_9PLAT|nr:unnamed protein product [Protopolystoma xenopodis]